MTTEEISEAMAIRRKIVGVLLRQARLEAGKTQKECAAWLGCPASRMSQYELGRTDIPFVELERLAALFQVPLTCFLPEGRSAEEMADDLPPDLAGFARLPEEMREFIAQPDNYPYLRVAFELRGLPAEALRNIAAALMTLKADR